MEERTAPMERFDRREILVSGSAARACCCWRVAASLWPRRRGEQLIPWADQPPPVPPRRRGL